MPGRPSRRRRCVRQRSGRHRPTTRCPAQCPRPVRCEKRRALAPHLQPRRLRGRVPVVEPFRRQPANLAEEDAPLRPRPLPRCLDRVHHEQVREPALEQGRDRRRRAQHIEHEEGVRLHRLHFRGQQGHV